MKFVAKELERTKDVSRADSSTGEIARSIVGVVLAAALAYLALGAIANAVAVRIDPRTERRLAFLRELLPACDETFAEVSARAQRIVDRMVERSDLPALDYRVCVIREPAVNALAAPGGAILLTSALIEEVESEEELAMVLGHELGHFAQRDHLKGLGRMLLLGTALATLGLQDMDGLVAPFVTVAERRHSRAQETGADTIGLGLVYAVYQHAGGATDFFERLGRRQGGVSGAGTDERERRNDARGGALGRRERAIPELMSTHPDPAGRAERLRELVRERGYAVRETKPFDTEPTAD